MENQEVDGVTVSFCLLQSQREIVALVSTLVTKALILHSIYSRLKVGVCVRGEIGGAHCMDMYRDV